MSGTLTLHWENVLSWLETLGRRLGNAYLVKVSSAGYGGGWLATIDFRGTNYQLRLYQVELGGHYVVALCEAGRVRVVCHRAWSLNDTTHAPQKPSWMFCTDCVRCHSTDPSCGGKISELIWNDPGKSDDENVESVVLCIFEGAKHHVDEYFASIT